MSLLVQLCRAAVCVVALLALPRLAAAQPVPWACDTIHLHDGQVLLGLITKETSQEIHFWRIFRNPGRRTWRYLDSRPMTKVSRIERVSEEERRLLQVRVALLDPERESRLLRGITLQAISWGNQGKQAWQHDAGEYSLFSSCGEATTRRAALRLRQCATVLNKYFPIDAELHSPCTVFLVGRADELPPSAPTRNLLNPSWYDPIRRQITCITSWEDIHQQGQDLLQDHRDEWHRLACLESLWRREWHGQIPKLLLSQLEQSRLTLDRIRDSNHKALDRVRQNFMRGLTHEAFHAHFSTFVAPMEPHQIPRWLDEGIAQAVDGALWECDEIRWDCPDAGQMNRAREAAREDRFVPLTSLLIAGPERFQVASPGERIEAERYYLTSWALAHFLITQKELLEGDRVRAYLAQIARGTSPFVAAELLFGESMHSVERAFIEYWRGGNKRAANFKS